MLLDLLNLAGKKHGQVSKAAVENLPGSGHRHIDSFHHVHSPFKHKDQLDPWVSFQFFP